MAVNPPVLFSRIFLRTKEKYLARDNKMNQVNTDISVEPCICMEHLYSAIALCNFFSELPELFHVKRRILAIVTFSDFHGIYRLYFIVILLSLRNRPHIHRDVLPHFLR